ncbi:glycosyltransferase [Priestia megaterium]
MKINKAFTKSKLLIIGPYPPPIGGISIHIKRSINFLIQKNFCDFSVLDDSGSSDNKCNNVYSGHKIFLLLTLLLKCKNSLIHYHSHNWIIRFILIIIAKFHGSKVCFTFHSFRDNIESFNVLKRLIVKYVLNHGDHFIAVSKNEKEKLIKYGCDNDKVSVIPAFINPSVEKEEEDLIPSEVEDFIKRHKIIITANASGLRFFNNEDLYGIDMCIELIISLKRKLGNKVGFIFLLPQIDNEEYFEKLCLKIEEGDIANNFLFITKKIPMFPIIEKSTMFLRPTNSDGDAISIRESLYFKVPAIASDVVKRPEGTIIFKNRDQQDLETKVLDVINNFQNYKDGIIISNSKDYAEELFQLYEALIK